MQQLRYIIQSLMLGAGLLTIGAVIVPSPALADHDPKHTIQQSVCKVNPDPNCEKQGETGFTNLFKNIINTIIYIVGAASVLMVVIGGLRYVLSGGDPAGIKNAKDTILYALIGLVVAIMAFALVNFVLAQFK